MLDHWTLVLRASPRMTRPYADAPQPGIPRSSSRTTSGSNALAATRRLRWSASSRRVRTVLLPRGRLELSRNDAHEHDATPTPSRSSTTPPGPGSSARARAPSRRSTSTRCSTSPPRPRSTASSSTAFDLFLFLPHINIDATDDDLKALADKASSRGLTIGSVVAPVWPPTGGGSAMDEGEGRKKFLEQVHKGCRIARRLRELGVRPYGVVRIDSACGAGDWASDPAGNQKKIAETFKQAAKIAQDHGERLAAEGEICWGGMHSWRKMVDLLERVGEPETVGFQADMAHTLLYTLGDNAPEDRILPDGLRLEGQGRRSTRP